MGRLQVDLLPRRRRGRAGQPQRAPDDPLLPRAGERRPSQSCPQRCVIDGEIVIAADGASGLRGAAAAAAPGRIAGADARREDARLVHRVRPARRSATTTTRGRPFSERRAALVDALGRRWTDVSRHARHHGSGHCAALVLRVRGRGSRRSRRQATDHPVPARQANHVQDQARSDGRLRRRRIPAAQVRRRRDRLAAARALQRRRHARVGRRDRRLPDGQPSELLTELQPLVTTFDEHPWNWAAHVAAQPRTEAEFGRARAGMRARTCPSSPCDPSGSSKSATTTWKARGSATQRNSTAGAPTANRGHAPMPSSTSRSHSPSATSSPACAQATTRFALCPLKTSSTGCSILIRRCAGRWNAMSSANRPRCGSRRARGPRPKGFGARLLALQDADGQWAGGAFFPADFDFQGPEAVPGVQPWTATTWTLNSLREWGIDAEVLRERRTAELLAANSRWEYDDLPYWGGEVDCCINALDRRERCVARRRRHRHRRLVPRAPVGRRRLELRVGRGLDAIVVSFDAQLPQGTARL